MDKREASALADVAKTSARTIDGVDVEFGKSLCWLDNGRHERLAIMRQGATMRRVGGVLTLPAAGWFIHGAVLNTVLVIFGMNALVATVFSLPNLSAQGIFPDRAIQTSPRPGGCGRPFMARDARLTWLMRRGPQSYLNCCAMHSRNRGT